MKLVIITGGSKGLGAALIDMYQKQGFMITDLSRSGQSDYSIRIDLSNTEKVLENIPPLFKKLASQSLEEVIFFNNAGTNFPIGISSQKDAKDVVANVNVNFTSPILLISEFVKAFQGSNCLKTIVNISSVAAETIFHGLSLYCGSKAGVEHFVRVVALEQKSNYIQSLQLISVLVRWTQICRKMSARYLRRISQASKGSGVLKKLVRCEAQRW